MPLIIDRTTLEGREARPARNDLVQRDDVLVDASPDRPADTP